MIIKSLSKIHESQSNIGPLIPSNQSYLQYKKNNSELSLNSEQRDYQIDQYKEQQKVTAKESRNFSLISSKSRQALSQNEEIQQNCEESQGQNFLQQIKTKNVRNRFINNLFKNSYVLPKKYKPHFIDNYISQINNLKNTLSQNDEKNLFKIFQPGNQLLLYWDMVGIFINMLSLWLSPFQAAFNFSSPGILYSVIIIYLLLDVLVNLNRSTISMGEIINTRGLIIKNYFKGNAFYDIISLMIWIEISVSRHNGFWQEILQIIQLIVSIKKILTNFDQFFESLYTKGIFTGLTDLISLILSIYFFAHVMACIWFYIGDKSSDYLQSTWLKKLNIEDESLLIQYNYSIYWAITTIVTVGYGDITPQNWIEMTFSSIMMVLSSCVYAYSLNSIGIILKNFQDNKYQYKKMLLRLNNFMDKNKVQLELQLRARNFLKFNSFQNENYENQEEVDNIMLKMPERLRNSINNDIQLQILNQITFLKDIFTSQTVSEISKILETVYLTPDEVLYSQNEYSDPSLYYIYSGSVLVYEEKSKKVLATLKEGQKFGEFQFFTGLYPKSSVKSAQSAILYKINREQLLQIIQYKEKDFQRFNHIKDQVILNHDYSKCFACCSLCSSSSHEVIDCPLMTYKPDLEQRLKRDNFYEIFQIRSQFKRNQTKQNSLNISRQIDSSIRMYQEQKFNSIAQLSDYQSNRYAIGSADQIQTMIEKKSVCIIGDTENQQKSFTSVNKISQSQARKRASIRPSIIAITPLDRRRQQQLQQQLQQQQQQQQQQMQFQDQYSSNQIQMNQSIKRMSSEIVIIDRSITYHLDVLKEFRHYMPQNNLSNIIKKVERIKGKKIFSRSKKQIYSQKYSIFYFVKIMGQKMRRKLQRIRDNSKC